MAKNSAQPSRKPNRLDYFNYSSQGAYFVTVCSYLRVPVLFTVADNGVTLLPAGAILEKVLRSLPDRFEGLRLDHRVLMPNHWHAVFFLPAGAAFDLPAVMQACKSIATLECIRAVKAGEMPAFDRKVFQRGYFEHVVRDEEGLQRIRQYIIDNPAQWELDRENPKRSGLSSFYKWLDAQYPPTEHLGA